MNEKYIEVSKKVINIIPLIMRQFDQELKTYDPLIIPAQLKLMGILANHRCNLTELAAKHNVTSATMSSSISNLVEKGWVTRYSDPSDRRVVHLELTDAGKAVVNHFFERINQRMCNYLAELSPEDLVKLEIGMDILEKTVNTKKDGQEKK